MGRRQPAELSGPPFDAKPRLSNARNSGRAARSSKSAVLGVVLAGGLSRRLGGTKAVVELGGRALIAYPLDALAAAGLEAVVVAKADTPLPELNVPIWIEKPGCNHPAHGIATALGRAGSPIVACGCDTPFLPPQVLSLLANRDEPLVTLESGRGLEPLPGRYSPAAIEELEAAAVSGTALRALVGRLKSNRVTELELRQFGDPTQILLNVNTEQDRGEAEAILRAER